MSGIRLVPLPIDHLEAELRAFPLASEASLRLALVDLRLQLTGHETESLWRDAERELLGAWPAVGLDECVAIRDRLWFRDVRSGEFNPTPVPLGRYVRNLANHVLEICGTVAVPSLRTEASDPPNDDLESRARNTWRWLSFALPPDLLLAALNRDSTPHAVDLLLPVLGRGLADRGFGEIHLHLGAALDFSLLWVATLCVLAEPNCPPDAFLSPGACLDEGRKLGRWLMRAALARYVLAAFLRSGASDFRRFLHQNTGHLVSALGASGTATLAEALRDLERGRLTDNRRSPTQQNHASLRALYRRLVRPRHRLPDQPDDVWSFDPVAAFVPWSRERGATPEIGFVAEALRHLEFRPKDRRFARLFWQTVRVRCLYYRHVVQRPMTPGLQWFIRSFDRMRAGRRLVGERLKTESALRLGNHEKGLLSLEIRTSPDATLNATSTLVQAVVGTQRRKTTLRVHSPLVSALGTRLPSKASRPTLEFGLVLHFPRDRGGGWSSGKPAAFWRESHADPRKAPGYRYGRFYRQQRRRARTLARYLLAFPASLTIIRGLDLCADETAVPTWVLAPLLRHVRDAGRAASRTLRESFARDVPPLRTTVHAGEDFIHLLTGLRQIDQSIERFHLRSGDRLGHALALGVDTGKWARRAGRIAMPREDRLFDLLWEWGWYTRTGQGPGNRLEMLQREMTVHTRAMFDEDVKPLELEELDDFLHKEIRLRLLGFPSGWSVSPPSNHFKRAWQYLTSPHVFDRGREIIRVDPLKEEESLRVLQNGLRRKVATRGLTIEVNPSSNLLIGHLGELKDHPLWRLRPPRGEGEVVPLSVCIGSDDPLTFATRLPEEYQHLYDALILAGYSESEAHAWIDAARQAGLDARFTLPVDKPFLEIEPWLLGSGPTIAPPP